MPELFALSTKGKPSWEKDLPEEEVAYKSLAEASGGVFTTDEVRVIRRVFDRADEDGNRFVDTNELRKCLEKLHEDVATRVLEEVLAESEKSGDAKWSFSAFVHMLRVRLTSDERIGLIAKEEEYIRSMGINEEEKELQKEFNSHREERRRSTLMKVPSNVSSHRPVERRRESVANDVEEYRREFGLE